MKSYETMCQFHHSKYVCFKSIYGEIDLQINRFGQIDPDH